MAERPRDFKAKDIGMIMYDTLEDTSQYKAFSLLLLLERPPSAKGYPQDSRPYFTALAIVPAGTNSVEHERHDHYVRVGLATTWDENMFDAGNTAEKTIVLL